MSSYSNSIFALSLRRLAQFVRRHRTWFVFPQILLSVLCLVYTARWLNLDMNRDHLIGPKIRYQQIYLDFQKEFPGEGNDLVVTVESDRAELNVQFIERLAEKVKPETNLFTDVFYKGDLVTLGHKALLLVPLQGLEGMRQNLHDYRPWLEEFGQATNLDSLFGLINKQFRTARPVNGKETTSLVQIIPFLQSIVSQAIQSAMRPGSPPAPELEALLTGAGQSEQKIYVTIDQGRIYLLTARPKSEALISAAIERLRRLIDATQTEVPGVNAGVTGSPVLGYDEMHQAERDTTKASIVAFILCSALFIIAYRQVWRPLKAALCLLIGMGYTMGFTTLAIGRLNILTITFVPMLIGLAIDFGIHFISRYEEEMRNRRTEAEAVDRTMSFTGQGIVTAALTTAAAFLAMALTNFRGIQEMGIISGCGLLLCLVPMMTALPVLLMHGRQNLRDRQLGPAGQKRVRIELLWLQHPATVIIATALLCLGASLEFHRIHFDYDLLHMQSQALSSVRNEKKLIQSAGAATLYGAVVADSASQAREYEAKIKQLPAVANVRSAIDFFTEDQNQKLEVIQSIKRELEGIHFAPVDRGPIKLDPLSATMWYLDGYLSLAAEAAKINAPDLARQLHSLELSIYRLRVLIHEPQPEIPKKLTEFQQAFFDSLHQTIEAIQTQDTTGPLRPQDLPPALRNRFIGVTGKYMLQVYSRQNLWEHENQKALMEQLDSVIPPDRVTGTPFELYHNSTLLKKSYEQAARYALIAIIIMVLLHFRSLLWVGLALLPVAVGAIWLLGFMGLANIPFNPANIMTLPLVLGIGVTNGVQILNRFAEEQQPSIFAKSTGKAVLVSGLTAIIGFGSLMVARHQGIRSLGIVMSVGLASCMIAALTVLPALLRILRQRGWLVAGDAQADGAGRR